MNSLVEFWKEKPEHMNFHPADERMLRENGFDNLPIDFRRPPPVHMGNPETCIGIVLYNSPNYKVGETDSDFSSPSMDVAGEVNRQLMAPGTADPAGFGTYFREDFRLLDPIRRGEIFFVNGFPYRCWNHDASVIRRLTKDLPSCKKARHWLEHEAVPMARAGKYKILFHHTGKWFVDFSVSIDHIHIGRSKNVRNKNITLSNLEWLLATKSGATQ